RRPLVAGRAVEARGAARRGRDRPLHRDDRSADPLGGDRHPARPALDRRPDERIQPARQHGRPRGHPGRDRGDLLRRGGGVVPVLGARARVRARRRRGTDRVPAVQPPAGSPRARVDGRQRLATRRVHARVARARLGLHGRLVDPRHAGPAGDRARGADPRHDARHGRAPARRPAGHPGRPRPQLAPARRARCVGDVGRRAARDRLGRARRDQPRLRGVRERPGRGDRRADHVRPAGPVRELPRRRRPRRRDRTAPARRLHAAHDRGARRRRADRSVVPRRLLPPLRRHRVDQPAHVLPDRASDAALLPLHRLRPARPLRRRAPLRRRTGCAPRGDRRHRLRGAGGRAAGADAATGGRLLAGRSHHRRAHLQRRDHRVALRRARRDARARADSAPRRAPGADHRRRPLRAQPAARAPRDAGRARRRLRRRRSRARGPAVERRARDRRHWRARRPYARPRPPRRRARDDPQRPARPARRDRPRVRDAGRNVPLRPARSRSGSADGPPRDHSVTADVALFAGRERSWYDRLAAAYPLVVGYVLLLILYGWQVSRHPAPWNFIDELQWAALSRGVAHTGRPELRSHPAGMHSLYTYFLAPAWWLGATGKAYAAAKYLNAAAVAASIFPAYGLARLFVPRPAAYVVGLAAAATPAVAYAGMLIPEPLAYLWSVLVLFLLARALRRPGRVSAVLALASLAIAPAVRSELAVLIPAAAIAAAFAYAGSARGRRRLGSWTTRERIGVGALIALGVVWAGAFVSHHSTSWQVGSAFHHRLITYGLWAIG